MSPEEKDKLTRRDFIAVSIAGVGGTAGSAAAASGKRPPPAAPRGAELAFLSIREASELIAARKVSPVELTEACLARIERFDPRLNTFIAVLPEEALAAARAAEREVMKGEWRGPLHGIPVALKDLIDLAGVATTAGSQLFKDRVAEQDATVVGRLKDAGAVQLGKLNMHECAYGVTSITSFFGPVRNPWDEARAAGGSSGGSAAAVAAGLCYAALGTDTGGSIRIPAACCGIVGLKPTYGRVSKRGVLPLSTTLDHVGPMARSAADTALVLGAIAGYDQEDLASELHPLEDLRESPWRRGSRLRVGLPRTFFFEQLDPDVDAALKAALAVLASLGAELREVPIEVNRERTLIRAEAYASYARFMEKQAEAFQAETLGKLRMGAAIDVPAYLAARADVERLRRVAQAVYADVDVLVTPTVPVSPPRFADWPKDLEGILAGEGQLGRNVRPFNMYGFPTVSVPCGHTGEGMPIGMQISGPPWAEARVLAVAAAYEQATEWHRRHPAQFLAG